MRTVGFVFSFALEYSKNTIQNLALMLNTLGFVIQNARHPLPKRHTF